MPVPGLATPAPLLELLPELLDCELDELDELLAALERLEALALDADAALADDLDDSTEAREADCCASCFVMRRIRSIPVWCAIR